MDSTESLAAVYDDSGRFARLDKITVRIEIQSTLNSNRRVILLGPGGKRQVFDYAGRESSKFGF
jgi:hypothetical protein